ncbi:programmed cell death protein 2 [Truncatella angustata]|uniref:Programmed cell death protein 2 n=1 Tax=Truncatella angustata TaxID=152316 RepID=A0A9P8UGW5_9PEZI|nr:programmed cell death protein 2 [Truncatella angustata]KAH6651999.1 programmed cell death protein 2 [Truncatella angustata]
MAPYDDSDSSGGEEVEFEETNVLLGYASKDADEDTISRLGGYPDWLDSSTPPSSALARCKLCKDMMVLLLQLNGELPDRFQGHERRLYVFACRRKSCRRKDGSIRVLRGLRIAPGSKEAGSKKVQRQEKPVVKEQPKPQTNLGETLFGAKGLGSSSLSANPFATSASSSGNPFSSGGNPFSASKAETPKPAEQTTKTEVEEAVKELPKTFSETLSLNNTQKKSGPPPPPEPWPAEKDSPAPYPILYLADADYETLDPTPPPIPQATRMDMDDSGSASGGKEDKEIFESSHDADFQKFADRMAQNPEQVIRYEFGGQPLLYSKTDAIGQLLGSGRSMPRCGNCGGERAFEVQMTPNAIAELEAEEMSLEGMDWGTIIIGVCGLDCQAQGVSEGEAGYLEEWAGVQWEELTSRR